MAVKDEDAGKKRHDRMASFMKGGRFAITSESSEHPVIVLGGKRSGTTTPMHASRSSREAVAGERSLLAETGSTWESPQADSVLENDGTADQSRLLATVSYSRCRPGPDTRDGLLSGCTWFPRASHC